VAGTIDLGGRPEFAADDGAGRDYANLEDKSEVVAIEGPLNSATRIEVEVLL